MPKEVNRNWTGEPHDPSRRRTLKRAGLVGAGRSPGQILPAREATAKPSQPASAFLQGQEAAFIKAATARMIPGGNVSPGAEQADVTNFTEG